MEDAERIKIEQAKRIETLQRELKAAQESLKKVFVIFFKLCAQRCCILQALTNRLFQTPTRNYNGKKLFGAGSIFVY